MKTGGGKNRLLFFLLTAAVLFGCNRKPSFELYGLRGRTMGTTYSLKVVQEKGGQLDASVLKTEVDSLLQQINRIMSTYLEDSELSHFNRAPAGKWIPISEELFSVLREARRVSELSGGAFDITVGPLVNLWGFGPEMRPGRIPEESEIAAGRALVGYEKIELQEQPRAAKKAVDGMYCDLSAIAKGWGVDRVADFLESKGFDNYMVEIGGEIRAKGVNGKGEPWRIGISSPDAQTAIQRIIRIGNNGVATSGDYRNYFEENGVRYSHTIDPATGRPITHRLASVTVIHPSCMTADAFATAIDVLGPEKGMALAERERLPVFMIVKSSHGFEEIMNSAFKPFLKQ